MGGAACKHHAAHRYERNDSTWIQIISRTVPPRIEMWGNITNTLWIWDYTTNFENFIAPWPDYFSLGPNMCAAAPSAAAAAAAATDNRLNSAASFN